MFKGDSWEFKEARVIASCNIRANHVPLCKFSLDASLAVQTGGGISGFVVHSGFGVVVGAPLVSLY